MVLGILGKKGLTAHYFYCFSVSQGVTLGSALSSSVTSSFTRRIGLSRTQSELSSPRSSDASLTRKNKLWPFSKKVLEGDPAMTLVQLDVKEGNVNGIVNESVRSTYQVSDVIDMKQDELNPTVLTVVLSEERGHVYQFQTTHDLAVFRLTLLEVSAGAWTMIRFPRTVLRKGNIKKQGKTGIYFERFAVIVPQKLFIMKSRKSFYPSSTVCLTDAVPDYDDIQHTIHLQAGLREYIFKGMSQQDAKGWSQALATACVLKYGAQPLTEETLLEEQHRAEAMLQAASDGIAPTAQDLPQSQPEVPAAAEDEEAATAAYLSKTQMLRELGFLSESSPEADAFARANGQLLTAQADSSTELSNMAEADSGVPTTQRGVVRGPTGQNTDEERAALARSKGWAPRALPTAKAPVPPTLEAAPLQPLPWSDPSLRFTSAPVFDDEQASEELQTTSPSVTASSADVEPFEAQQEAEVQPPELPLELDFDDLAQTNWEARAIFNRRSSSNQRDADGLDDMANGSQAEWELRACWGLPFRRPSQNIPLPGFAIRQNPLGQVLIDMQSEFQADFQQQNDVTDASDQDASNEGLLGLHRVTKEFQAELQQENNVTNASDSGASSEGLLGLNSVTEELQAELQQENDGTGDSEQGASSEGLLGLNSVTEELQAELQQKSDVTDASDQDTGNAGRLGLQRVTKQAAATAALQKALSNIQYIATGSQITRAAVAEAAAEAESLATLSQVLQPSSELLQGCTQVPHDNDISPDSNGIGAYNQIGNMADMPPIQAAAAQQGGRNSIHAGMAPLGDISTRWAATQSGGGDSMPEHRHSLADMSSMQASQLGLQASAAACSLAEQSSSNGSHFSLDADSPSQTFDLANSMEYAATQLVQSAVGAGADNLAAGHFLVDYSAVLDAPVTSKGHAEIGAAAQAESELMPQPHEMMLSQPALVTQQVQPPAASAAHAFAAEQLRSEVSSIQLPAQRQHSSGSVDISNHNMPSVAAPAETGGALVSTQASALEGKADWQAPDAALLLHQQAQSASGGVLEAVQHPDWSSSNALPDAAMQPGQEPLTISPLSEAMSLGSWESPPRLAQQPCEQQPLSNAGGLHHVSERCIEPSRQEAAAHDTAATMAHGSDKAWQDQLMGGKQSNSLAEEAGIAHSVDIRALTPQAWESSHHSWKAATASLVRSSYNTTLPGSPGAAWHPSNSSVARLLGRASLQPASDASRLRSLLDSADPRRQAAPEQHGPGTAWPRSSASLFGTEQSKPRSSDGLFGTKQSKAKSSDGLFGKDESKPRSSAGLFGTEQSKGSQRSQDDQQSIGRLEQPDGSFQQAQDRSGKLPLTRHQLSQQSTGEASWQEISKAQAFPPMRSPPTQDKTGSLWQQSEWAAQADSSMSKVHMRARFTSGMPPASTGLQAYRLVASPSHPSLFSGKAADTASFTGLDQEVKSACQPVQRSSLISTRFSEQPSPHQPSLGDMHRADQQDPLAVQHLHAAPLHAAQQVNCSEQWLQQHADARSSGGRDLYSAVSVQPRGQPHLSLLADAAAKPTRAPAVSDDLRAQAERLHPVRNLAGQSPVAVALSEDSPWDDQPGSLHLRHQSTWHLPNASQADVKLKQQQQQQPLSQHLSMLHSLQSLHSANRQPLPQAAADADAPAPDSCADVEPDLAPPAGHLLTDPAGLKVATPAGKDLSAIARAESRESAKAELDTQSRTVAHDGTGADVSTQFQAQDAAEAGPHCIAHCSALPTAQPCEQAQPDLQLSSQTHDLEHALRAEVGREDDSAAMPGAARLTESVSTDQWQVYKSHMTLIQDMQPAVGLADVKSLAPMATAYLQQVPADSVRNEADSTDSWIPSAASGQRVAAVSESAACKAAEQMVSSLTPPHCQAFHTPSPPPQPLPILFSWAADHLPANLNTAAMVSSPVLPTAACTATAAAPASNATPTAVATLPGSLSTSEPAVVGTDSACSSAMLLPGVPSAAAAHMRDSPQADFRGGPHLHSVAEEMLQKSYVTSALPSGPLVATKLLAPAAVESPSLQAEEQSSSPPPASRLSFKPASTAGVAPPSLAIPTSAPSAAVLPPTISAASADQQAAAEEAAAAATMTHLAAPAVNHWQSNATVLATVQRQEQHQQQQQHQQHQQQQHDLAPVLYEQGGVFPSQVVEHLHHHAGRGQEGVGDLLYDHLAAVLATVPALRDRVLTFAPLHSQLQGSSTDQPGRGAAPQAAGPQGSWVQAPTLPSWKNQADLTVGPVDWQHNALYASDMPANMPADSPSPVRPWLPSQLSSSQGPAPIAAPIAIPTAPPPAAPIAPPTAPPTAPSLAPPIAASAQTHALAGNAGPDADAQTTLVNCKQPAEMLTTAQQQAAHLDAAVAETSISHSTIARHAADTSLSPASSEQTASANQAGMAQLEASMTQHEASMTQHEASVTQHEVSMTQHEASTTQHEASMPQPEARMTQHEASVTQHEASMTQREPAAAIQASLKHTVSGSQSSMTCQWHEHAGATQHSPQSSSTNAVPAYGKPEATCSLSGLSLSEAELLLQLINRLQAAGSLAAPSSAVTHVAGSEQMLPAQAGFAMVSEGGTAADCTQARTLHQQPQAKQHADMSTCSSSGDVSMNPRLPTTSLAAQLLPGQPQHGKHGQHGKHDQHGTHSAADPFSAAQMPAGHAATPTAEPRLKQGAAALAHAGHAGLLRFKRQWPMPRPLMLSDSDDSDSLGDFDSIADFHVESDAGQKLVKHNSCRTAVKPDPPGTCLSTVAVQRSVTNRSKDIGAGPSMQLPLVPGIQVQVSMPPSWPHPVHTPSHRPDASQSSPDAQVQLAQQAQQAQQPGKLSDEQHDRQQRQEDHAHTRLLKYSGRHQARHTSGRQQVLRESEAGHRRKLSSQLSQLSLASEASESSSINSSKVVEQQCSSDHGADSDTAHCSVSVLSPSSFSLLASEQGQVSSSSSSQEPASPQPCPHPRHARGFRPPSRQPPGRDQQERDAGTKLIALKQKRHVPERHDAPNPEALQKGGSRHQREKYSAQSTAYRTQHAGVSHQGPSSRHQHHARHWPAEADMQLSQSTHRQPNAIRHHAIAAPAMHKRRQAKQQLRAEQDLPSESDRGHLRHGRRHASASSLPVSESSSTLEQHSRPQQVSNRRSHAQVTKLQYDAETADRSKQSRRAHRPPAVRGQDQSSLSASVHTPWLERAAAAVPDEATHLYSAGGKLHRHLHASSARQQIAGGQGRGSGQLAAALPTGAAAAASMTPRQSLPPATAVPSSTHQHHDLTANADADCDPGSATHFPHDSPRAVTPMIGDSQRVGAALHGHALETTRPDTAAVSVAQEAPSTAAALHSAAVTPAAQDDTPGPMQALLIALENMTNMGQQRLAALGQGHHPSPAAAAVDESPAAAVAAAASAITSAAAADGPTASQETGWLYPSTWSQHKAPLTTGGHQHEFEAPVTTCFSQRWADMDVHLSLDRGLGQEGEAEECMSPEASRRITSAACSVAQQVERAVCAAVQAISPGRLPLSMTSQAYGQEATELSHTALMQHRLMQQMQTATGTDSGHSRVSQERSAAGSRSQHRSGSRDDGGGFMQHPVRGSGHHHYLPSSGDGTSPRAGRHSSSSDCWEAPEEAAAVAAEGGAYGDSSQHQLKRARLDHINNNPSQHWPSNSRDNRPSPEAGQPVASHACPDMGPGQGATPMQQGGHQGGHHFHWMPVFCQMGGVGGYEGHAPGSHAGSWVHSMHSMPSVQAQLGAQGGLQAYPCAEPQPGMPTPAAAAAAVTSQAGAVQAATQDSSLITSAVGSQTANDSNPVESADTTDVDSAQASDMQQHTQAGAVNICHSQGVSSRHKSVDAVQGRAGLGDAPLGMAGCLPKLEKQLSNRSSEDLTAKAVAKLWGVNLRRYTGRSG